MHYGTAYSLVTVTTSLLAVIHAYIKTCVDWLLGTRSHGILNLDTPYDLTYNRNESITSTNQTQLLASAVRPSVDQDEGREEYLIIITRGSVDSVKTIHIVACWVTYRFVSTSDDMDQGYKLAFHSFYG